MYPPRPSASLLLLPQEEENQRSLKLSSLSLVDILVKNYSPGLTVNILSPLLESDLHIAQLTLALLTCISLTHRQAIPKIHKSVLPEVVKLALSPLLRGQGTIRHAGVL